MFNQTIGCVIVTYNRLDKLKITLQHYANQIKKPEFMIVVNNASTDGTAEFLDEWKNLSDGFVKEIITTTKNLGGSGGFYIGEERALEKNASWIMIADDDAYPAPDYLSGICHYLDSKNEDSISIVCGKVIEHGNYVNIHRSIWRSKWDRNFHIPASAINYTKTFFIPDFVSYVGIIINRDKLQKAGLVNKENFIWCDDTEHTYRLSKFGKIVCLPAYSIYHDVESANDSLSWKYYYGYRNDLIFFKRHFPAHFWPVLIKLLLKTLVCPLHGKSWSEISLRFAAIWDALAGNMGVHSKYKPGWKP